MNKNCKGRFRLAGALLALGLGFAASAQQESEMATQPGRAAGLEAYLDGAVGALMRDKKLPGLTLAVVFTGDADRPGSRPDLLEGYGLADVEDGRPVDAHETLFRIGSISKTFIWTAAMMLADRGQLDLDADVNTYLDEVRIEPTFDQPVTMKHLMTHRAGFEDTLELFTTTDDDPRSLARALAETQPTRVYAPGERVSYSNWGAALAAHVVARVSGMGYRQFLDTEILEALGMASTTLAPPSKMDDSLRRRLATGYAYREGDHVEAEPMQIGPFAPAGGMASTAADMARWMRFHLNRGELDGVRLMSRPAHDSMWKRTFGEDESAPGVAHGFQARPYRGMDSFGHGGSTGNFNSNMVMVPILDLGVFASQNTGSSGYDAVGVLPQLVIDRLLATPPASAEPRDWPPQDRQKEDASLQEYAGNYVSNRRSFTSMTAIFGAQTTLSVAPAEDGGLVVATGGEIDRYYRMPGHRDVFENRYGDRLLFQRDEDGEIVAVNDGTGVHSHEQPGALTAPGTLYASLGAAGLLALTTLLGFWRRWRHVPETTGSGKRAGTAALLAAILLLVFLGTAAAALIAVSSMTIADFSVYPPKAVIVMSYAAWMVAVAAIMALAALMPAWRGSGWSLWRKGHVTLFALALAFFAFQLWQWRVFGAPFI